MRIMIRNMRGGGEHNTKSIVMMYPHHHRSTMDINVNFKVVIEVVIQGGVVVSHCRDDIIK